VGEENLVIEMHMKGSLKDQFDRLTEYDFIL